MAEHIADVVISTFGGIVPNELIVFLISMLPIVELRGGMFAAKLFEIGYLKAFLICYAGNMLPVPFILLFIRRVFRFLKNKKIFSEIVKKLEDKTYLRSEKALRWKGLGLLLFVAIPMPGTGGWTGSLIAALLEMRIRVSFPVIAFGVFIADLIMGGLIYGILGSIV